MSLRDILAEKKKSIIAAWIDAALAAYDPKGQKFFKEQKDPFANPAGSSVREGLSEVVECLVRFEEIADIPAELAQFIKLRAVQDISPSESVAFIAAGKTIIQKICGKEQLLAHADDWFILCDSIDRLMLRIFDLYMEDRERLNKIKLDELKSGNYIMTRGMCPSAMMRKNREEKQELKFI